jgi:hypothetical protein
MKAFWLGFAIALLATMQAAAADVGVTRRAHRAPAIAAPPPAIASLPLALRTLSKRSAAVLASTPCWRDCTTFCGAGFQQCLRVDVMVGCMAYNNQCELSCLKQCRLLGGPLVGWTDY